MAADTKNKLPTPTVAYDALNDFFTTHQDEVLEIEVLPPAIQPTDGLLMQDGVNLGIPKKVLALAFVKARELFFATFENDFQTALAATRVMLLFDPEHITAANYRKRAILEPRKEQSESGVKGDGDLLRLELVFINSILTSPLHRQSKSPTLWYHRLWLSQFLLRNKSSDSFGIAFFDFIKTELDAIFRAGEHHPKNYYAWQYARRLFAKAHHMHADEWNYSWKATYPKLLFECSLLVKQWCCQHPSDISGWMFLLFLLSLLQCQSERERVVELIVNYTNKLQAKQESLWVFLRAVSADTASSEVSSQV